MKKEKKSRGKDVFNAYYRNIYGNRWDDIIAAFENDPDYTEISPGYYIDSASTYPVKALAIEKLGETLSENNSIKILDMCAAPGGKTLQIAFAVEKLIQLESNSATAITIKANDRSASRRNRLSNVLNTSLSPILRSVIQITSYDSSKWGLYEKNIYDRILLDAPCSSERHVFNSPAHLEQWSETRTKQLSERQFPMLAAALDAAKSEGIIIYSTCSVSPMENDGVIQKLFKKREDMFSILEATEYPETGEKTKYGIQLMPDRCGGAGPIYFAVIKKEGSKENGK